jgi:hypothetical protein
VSTVASDCIPFVESQTNAWYVPASLPPTMTDPSAFAAAAKLPNVPPGRSPRPTIPPPEVQRNASGPDPTWL